MERGFFILCALSLCLLVLFFAPTVIAFVKFVHLYNHKGFFDAAELNLEEEKKLSDTEIENVINDIIWEEMQKPAPRRFYDYIHALDQNAVVEEYTKAHTKFRQYTYWERFVS